MSLKYVNYDINNIYFWYFQYQQAVITLVFCITFIFQTRSSTFMLLSAIYRFKISFWCMYCEHRIQEYPCIGYSFSNLLRVSFIVNYQIIIHKHWMDAILERVWKMLLQDVRYNLWGIFPEWRRRSGLCQLNESKKDHSYKL